MIFCTNCGTKVVDGAKFCQKCGVPINGISFNNGSQRQQEYAGKIIKCPNCGETLMSFNVNCPACGYELRSAKSIDSVSELTLRLDQIEATRVVEKPRSIYKAAYSEPIVSKTDEQKATLIRTFPIPNTKEDLLEFLILTKSNIDYDLYKNDIRNSAKVVSDAWKAKFEQAYQKAKVSFGNDPEFQHIQTLHQEMTTNIKKAKISNWKVLGIAFLILAVGFIWIFVGSSSTNQKYNAREVARLESVVEDIKSNLKNGKYKIALTLAETLEYGGYDSVEKRAWNVKRGYLIEQIIDEAAKNGVKLEYIPSEGIDNVNEDSPQERTNSGFVEGSKEGLQPSLDIVQEIINDKESINRVDTGINSQKNVVDGKSNIVSKKDTYNSDLTIEKGNKYAYMSDEWNVYIASAISDSVIKIEHWGKTLSTSKTLTYKSDIGTYKINDRENGFSWIDEEHMAFIFTLQDKNNSRIKQPTSVVFTVNINDSDKNKGSNYDSEIICYSFRNDDWNFYRAIPLTETMMKIECWNRGFKFSEFLYGYDMGVIDLSESDANFEWTDDEHTAFTITMQDLANSNLEEPTFVAFTMENLEYVYMNVKSYMNSQK